MGRFEINKKLWPIKAHYFLWNAGTAPVQPYLSVYAKQLGFSSFLVGTIYTILPICGLIARPIMGAIADKYRCQKKIFLFNELLTAVMFLAIFYIPETKHTTRGHFSCDYSESVFDTCLSNTSHTRAIDKHKFQQYSVIDDNNLPEIVSKCELNCPLDDKMWYTVKSHWNYSDQSGPKYFKFQAHVPLDKTQHFLDDCVIFKISTVTLPDGNVLVPRCPTTVNTISSICDINCDSYYINDMLPRADDDYSGDDDVVIGSYQFWMFVAFMILCWVGQALVVSVSDTICFQLLGDEPNKYGNQRCFGALGWGIIAVITGLIIDATSKDEAGSNYTYAFYMGFGLLLLDFLVSFKLTIEQKNVSLNILRDVSQLLTDVRICVFIVWCIFIGMCTGLIWNFLFWFIEEDLGGRNESWIKTLEGLVMAIQCLGGELPLFFLSGWIVRKIGHVHCMTFILLAMGLRFILYSLLTDPWWILPIEFFNGITFGLFYACMASYASIIAPPGTETTMQGLVGAVFEGIGASIGSFVGGYMFEEYSGLITYRIFGIVSLVLCVVHFSVQWLIQRSSKELIAYRLPDETLDPFVDDEQSQELKLVR